MGLLDLIDWGFFDIIIGPIISFIIKIIITLVLLGIGFFGAMRLPRPTAKNGRDINNYHTDSIGMDIFIRRAKYGSRSNNRAGMFGKQIMGDNSIVNFLNCTRYRILIY